MKKILSALICFICLFICTGCANASSLSDRNDIFTPAFQLIWNDFSTEFVKGRVDFVGLDPKVVYALNSSKFTVDDVDKNSYYKIIAPKSYELKAKIQREIFEKFGETSKILDDIDWTSKTKEEYILYAMLKKNVEFDREFQILENATFGGSKEKVKYFGIEKNADLYSKQLKPLFYNSPNDFALSLTTKEGDRMVLFRTNSIVNVLDLYEQVNIYTNKMLKLGESDKVFIPNISLSEKINYDMLCGKKIKKSRIIISKALEYVEFNLDNKGAKLKNEAVMDIMKMSLPIPGREKTYNFNKPFIVYMIEKDKTIPYFALRIKDTKFLVK